MEPDYSGVLSRLVPGETRIWWGRPDHGVWLSASDRWLIPFSLVWAGFAIFWEYTALSQPSNVFFILWGIPFVGAGLYMAAGWFLYKRWSKQRTMYVLTDKRVARLSGSTIRELWLPLIELEVFSASDRRHMSVFFGMPQSATSRRSSYGAYANSGLDFLDRSTGALGFFDVADVAGLQSAVGQVCASAR